MSTDITIGYAGMTHLGLNYAVAGAGKGFKVIGYDPSAAITTQLSAGQLHVLEPGLEQALQENQQSLTFTSDIQQLSACAIVYISPDVVTDDHGLSDLSYINQLIAQVIPLLNPQALLVILAQVPPGFTRKINFAATRLFYQVETLIFGQAVQRAQQPERFIVGCANPDVPLAPALATYLQAFNCDVVASII